MRSFVAGLWISAILGLVLSSLSPAQPRVTLIGEIQPPDFGPRPGCGGILVVFSPEWMTRIELIEPVPEELYWTWVSVTGDVGSAVECDVRGAEYKMTDVRINPTGAIDLGLGTPQRCIVPGDLARFHEAEDVLLSGRVRTHRENQSAVGTRQPSRSTDDPVA